MNFENSKENGKINSSTLEIYRKDIEDFDGFIVGKDLLDVETQDIINYIEELRKNIVICLYIESSAL